MNFIKIKLRSVARSAWSGLLLALLMASTFHSARAQFTQNKKDVIAISTAAFPVDVQRGYRTFRGKCSECHGLDMSLKMNLSPVQWSTEVKKMQAMPSSQFSDKQAESIMRFLNYDESERKAKLKTSSLMPVSAGSETVAAGRGIYEAQGCEACHSIAGNGGALKALDGVGTRLSSQQIGNRLRVAVDGSAMPVLSPTVPTTQVDELIHYLTTLK